MFECQTAVILKVKRKFEISGVIFYRYILEVNEIKTCSCDQIIENPRVIYLYNAVHTSADNQSSSGTDITLSYNNRHWLCCLLASVSLREFNITQYQAHCTGQVNRPTHVVVIAGHVFSMGRRDHNTDRFFPCFKALKPRLSVHPAVKETQEKQEQKPSPVTVMRYTLSLLSRTAVVVVGIIARLKA